MADAYVRHAQNVFSATIGSTAVTAGDMVYFDGTDWELADASAHTTFSEAMAVNTYASGDVGVLCTGGVVVDIDAPYTQGTAMYLSETAGAITATIPTTNAALKQAVGFALSTSTVRVDIRIPSYQNQFLPVSAYDTSGEPGLGVVTDGWPGPGLDAAAETAYIVGRFPDNFVELEMARIITSNTASSAVDYDFSVAAGYDNASNAQDTGTAITASTSETTPADNLLVTFDVSAALDSGLQGPGRNFSILIDPDGVGSGEQQILGMNLGCLVV
jgi:hypothetical protein